jgi:hypothetical protein
MPEDYDSARLSILPQRFWDKVNKTETCWLWTAYAPIDTGYGRFKYQGKQYDVHKLVWVILYGDPGKGMCVLHACDVRHCLRPEHLFTGTKADNVRDMDKKGRRVSPRGEMNGMAILTAEKVIEIRKRYAAGEKSPDLAAEYGVVKGQIWSVATYKSWKHVQDGFSL